MKTGALSYYFISFTKSVLFLFTVALFSIQLRAATETFNGVMYTYMVSNGEAYIGLGGGGEAIPVGTSGTLIIPTSLGGYPVTRINDYAFKNCNQLTNAIIPESVIHIGTSAFSGCSDLKSVTIPNTVQTINGRVFENCDSLTSIPFPASIKTIPTGAFAGCDGLISLIIPSNITDISFQAFYSCTGLKAVTITNNVTSIGGYSFQSCTALTSVIIGNSVTNIGDVAFENCAALTNLVIGNRVETIGRSAFADCTKLTSVTIPSSVTKIQDMVFDGCSFLKSIRIQDSVVSVGNYAFRDCIGLTNVVIGSGVKMIGYGAFIDCIKLSSITLPNGVTNIGDSAFQNCSLLTTVSIPDSVSSVGELAFDATPWLQSRPDGLVYVGKALYKYKGTCPASVTIQPDTLSISSYAFTNCSNLRSITIPDSVKILGDYAFRDCIGLTNAIIGSGVTIIGGYVFYNCSSLTSITIPSSVNSIGYSAFMNCTSLASIPIPDSVSSVSEYAFDATSWLLNKPDGIVYAGRHLYKYKGTCPASVTIQPDTLSIVSRAFSGCSVLKAITIPDSIVSIGNWAFENCIGLTNAIIGSGVTTIGLYSFMNCNDLKYISIPDGIGNIGVAAFQNCNSLTNVFIGNGLTNIGGMAFYSCPELKSINIPANVKTLGDSAFGNCVLLETATISSNVASINSSVFFGCTALKNVSIPPCLTKVSTVFPSCYQALTSIILSGSWTNIESFMFADCIKLSSITLPNGVTNIGDSAFQNCSLLTTVSIPDSVSSVGELAFDATPWLQSKPDGLVYAGKNLYKYKGTCPASVSIQPDTLSIVSSAFSGCSGLKSITIPGSVIKIGGSVFNNCSGLTNAIVGSGVTTIGSSAFRNSTKLQSVIIENCTRSVGCYLFNNCTNLSSVFFLMNAPAFIGSEIYFATPANLFTFVCYGTLGWDGVGTSPSLPAKWPITGVYRRNIGYFSQAFSGVTGQQLSLVGKTSATMISTDYSGNSGWYGYAKLGGIGLLLDGEMTGIEWESSGPGILEFDWMVSSEADYDLFSFYMAGASTTNNISGTGLGWQHFAYDVGGGRGDIHTFRWEYSKDPLGDFTGDDSGWVSAIRWTPKYELSVLNGNGTGWYTNGSTVVISSGTPPQDFKFDRWIGDTNYVGNAFASSTPVNIPKTNISLTATYVTTIHPLSVEGGTGSGMFYENTPVSVAANPDPMYKEFVCWAGDSAYLLDNSSSRTASMTMPMRSATLTANYRDSISRLTGSYGRTYSESGTANAITPDAGAASLSGTPAVKLGGAGVIPDNSFAAFETVVSGSGSILFQWKVSSESNSDYLKFKVDGSEVAAISGTKGSWTQVSNRVTTAGSHTLRWEYVKNGSLSSSTDAGWVDDIVWIGDVSSPVLSPNIISIDATNSLVTLDFIGERGIPYILQTNATLNVSGWGNWQPISPAYTGETNGMHKFNVIPPMNGRNNMFYRIKAQ